VTVPFDTTIIRTLGAIITSVTAVVIARLLLSRLGMQGEERQW